MEPMLHIIVFIAVIDINLLPAGLHCTVIPVAQVINCTFPAIIVRLSLALLIYPSIEHFTVIIKGISLAVNGSETDIAVVGSFISFTAGLHIVVMILSRILIFILIFVYYLYPGITNHHTIGVYIIDIIIILNDLFHSHGAAFFTIQPVPVVSRFLPGILHTVAIIVIEIPGSILLNPAGSCERGHGSADGKQGCCRCNGNYFCLLSHNECTLLFLFEIPFNTYFCITMVLYFL